jgi:hypothetical protein
MQVHAVAWSEMLRRLTMTHPDCPVTVWCNEDTPLIWGELLQDIAAVGMEVPLEGKDVVVQQIMDPAGFKRMQEYLRQKPPETEAQRRRVVAAFLGVTRRRPDRGGRERCRAGPRISWPSSRRPMTRTWPSWRRSRA